MYQREIPWRDKREHITAATCRRALRRLNDQRFRFLTQNKVVTARLLQVFGIRAPTFYGHLSTDVGQTFDGQPLRSCADLQSLVARAGIDRMCFKLLTGWAGRGFVKVSVARGPDTTSVVLEPQGHQTDLQTLWDRYLPYKKGHGYICQEVVEQHPELAELNPTSLNTVRTWMVRGPDGRWALRGAWLRVGVGRVAVDNGSEGGLTVPMDLGTGQLDLARDIRLDYRTYSNHPVSGVRIAGRRVPMWEEVREISARTALIFDYMSWLAIDIAVGTTSPIVIEINEQPDPICQLDIGQGWSTLIRHLARHPRDDRPPEA